MLRRMFVAVLVVSSLGVCVALVFSSRMLRAAAADQTVADTPPPQGTRLLRAPTVSASSIAFLYASNLWSVDRAGGLARRLTSFQGLTTNPHFSPDGKWLAFSAEYAGNIDVYVMPAEGGEPKRLTWHPGPDTVVGWTPDGKKVLFTSGREAYADFDRLYTIPVEGGVPDVLPMWRGEAASFSPDASRLAYVPNLKWQRAWKRYHGGQITPIYLVRLSDLQLEKVAHQNSNDDDP